MKAGLIIYLLARVDARANVPLARKLADTGNLVVKPDLPLNLPVFAPSAFDEQSRDVPAAFTRVEQAEAVAEGLIDLLAAQ